jgi:outer membrane protein OmpA-like peptidoglycan-associated protein/flagellar hook assembly protein FlgD
MMRDIRKRALVAVLAAAAAIQAFAYDPPAGGVLLPTLSSPQALSAGPSVTAADAPWADRLNPAASAGQQRPALDLGYVALTDFGKQGWGSALAAGYSLPKPYAVWDFGARLVYTPGEMTDLPLGTVVDLRAGIAKDVFPNFYVGAGVSGLMGGNGGFGWGLGLDLGVLAKAGDLGPFKDFTWGAVLANIGKGYETPAPATGAFGSSNPSPYTPPFTLSFGARGNLISTSFAKLTVGADLSLPTFQDLGIGLSAALSFRDSFSIKTSWSTSVLDLANASGRSLMPSLGVSAVIPLQRKQSVAGTDRVELKPTISAAKLYGDIWALGAGATISLGLVDKQAPEIKAEFPATSWGPAYVSPNSDGNKDSLDIPVAMADQRYVVGWTFTVSDEKGEVVRKIQNKESRPETQGLEGFWDRLVYVKKGVAVPDKLVWNGVADSGQVVPDGAYSASIEAVDDNGNRGSIGPFPVTIDGTAPTLQLSTLESPAIFSPDGDGNKDTLLFKISGSVEDAWKCQILDASGKAVRSVEFKDKAPADWAWDGKGDDGAIVPDGVYSFVLSATDRAGNSTTKRVDNILVNTLQPTVGLTIDISAFSPNGDGVKDAVNLVPSVPTKTGLVGWKLSVQDKAKRDVWSASGKDAASLKDQVAFDGRDDSLKALPEGAYQAVLSATYLNGHVAKAASPSFVLDLTAPSGTVGADRAAFNPAGAEGQDTVKFSQKGTKDAKWTSEITGPDGSAVKSFSSSPRPDAEIAWDGTNEAGKLVPDGVYSFRLKAADGAGNSFASAPVAVSVDTAKKAVRLLTDLKAFSPKPGSARDRLTLTAQVASNDKVRSYQLAVTALDAPGVAPGTAVKVWKDNKGVPDSFIWDGTGDNKAKAPDGRYAARLSVSYLNGDSADAATPGFVIDTVAPSVSLSASPLLFSPREGSKIKVVRFTQKSAPGDDWTGTLAGVDGKAVRAWSWKGQVSDFVWDGTDEAGNTVADGSYRYELASTDAAGNKGTASVPAIVVDQRAVQVFVTASETAISPNGDGYKDNVSFSLIVKLREGIESWRFAILDDAGKERSVFDGTGDEVPNKIVWDGRDSSGVVAQGNFTGAFSVAYKKGDVAEAKTGKIFVSIEGPKAEVSLTPDIFSPDNDGYNDEVAIGLAVSGPSEIAEWKFEIRELAVTEGAKPDAKPADRVFKSWSGTGAPAKSIAWDGRSDRGELVESATDYPFVFTARDALGNSARVEGEISVDVLVIRDGDRLKIKVPSIVFRPNGSDFNGLDAAIVQNNTKVIKRIAQILNKFKDYSILIEGHANSVAKISGSSAAAVSTEETRELIPLSTGRADLVKKLLTDNGVDARRLSTVGMGSSEPVVDFKDAQNRWKNRRVEFILIKAAQ